MTSIPWPEVLVGWPEAAVLVDRQGVVCHANALAEELLAPPGASLVGRHVESLVPHALRQRHAAHRSAWTADAQPRRMGHGADLFALRGTGEPFPAAIGLHPTGDGPEALVLATVVDLSERHRHESLVRTAEDERARLLRSLVAGLGHDLKNLLSVVIGNALSLQESDDPAALADLLTASRRSVELADVLMSYAQPRDEPMGRLALGGLVEHSEPLLRAMVPRTIQLRLRPTAGCTARARKSPVQQVLLNLVGNAADAIASVAPHSGSVVVTTQVIADRAVLEVHDDGCGMDATTLQRVFEPHFSTKDHGHGLGLAACRAIAHQLGGELTAESQPGRGSTFRLSLPADLD